MPTFIDESGDTGPSAKASRYFFLTAVWLEGDEHIDEYLNIIVRLKQDVLKLPATFEFHYAKNSSRQRAAFFDAVAPLSFNYALCMFDKPTFDPRTLSVERIRDETVAGLVGRMREWLLAAEGCKVGPAGLNERIVYDECYDANYIATLKAEFRSLLSGRGPDEKLIRSIKPGRSKADPRLQLADMICGAAASYLGGGDDSHYRLIRGKEIGIERLTGNEKRATDE